MGAWELKPKNLFNYLGKDNSHNCLIWTLSKIFFVLSLLNHVWICFSWLLWQNSTAVMKIFYKFTFLHHGNCDVNLSPWHVAMIDLLLHVSRPSHSQKKIQIAFSLGYFANFKGVLSQKRLSNHKRRVSIYLSLFDHG